MNREARISEGQQLLHKMSFFPSSITHSQEAMNAKTTFDNHYNNDVNDDLNLSTKSDQSQIAMIAERIAAPKVDSS